jgi:sterol desaturase/sphingolipid hydroxylase (fatty acid hydroxylase superfamily)
MIVDALVAAFGHVQQALFESAVQPLVFALGMGNLLEDAYTATGWLMVGVLQIMVTWLVIGALERWRPVEPVLDRAAVRVDIAYTLIHRLGFFRLALFFALDPLWDLLVAELRLAGFEGAALDALWPGFSDHALISFLIYLVVFDFIDYAVHRAQHRWNWWWALHALHHSQRQMTMWSDPRNHLLDDVLRDSVFVAAGLLLGVPPEQFVALVAVKKGIEALSHANVRIDFGPVFKRLLVSPQFHRVHHAIGIGHESSGPGSLGGCNFGVLFPWWDMLFRSTHWAAHDEYPATGVRDQLAGRDYGRGFWAQQWLGLKRLVRAG